MVASSPGGRWPSGQWYWWSVSLEASDPGGQGWPVTTVANGPGGQ